MFLAMAVKVIRDDGFLALYNGLSASCLRQATYTTTRFAIYGAVKSMRSDSNLNFLEKITLAAGSGAIGAFVGSFVRSFSVLVICLSARSGAPADLVNVRMQNDCKLPKEQRRNYKHAIDGIARIVREEGTKKLFNGKRTLLSRLEDIAVIQVHRWLSLVVRSSRSVRLLSTNK